MNELPIGAGSKLSFHGGYLASHWLRGQLERGGVDQAADLPVIYPGLDMSLVVPKIDFKTKKHFLWAGRLKEAKGADLAVDAVGLLKSRGIDVKLDIFGLGDPRERKAKRERIEAAGLIDQVRMRGIRPGQMAKYYARYDALLYTNREAEPFSITVLEAMLARLPVIASNIGGNAELLKSGENALVCEPGCVESLADAIVRFMALSDGGASLAAADYEALKKRHSHHSVCSQIEPILMEAVRRVAVGNGA
jgi:glycosyltransferase involved in cell wall biosynthesis